MTDSVRYKHHLRNRTFVLVLRKAVDREPVITIYDDGRVENFWLTERQQSRISCDHIALQMRVHETRLYFVRRTAVTAEEELESTQKQRLEKLLGGKERRATC